MKQEEKYFWSVVIPVWICEIAVWIIAFGRNLPFGYVIAFFLAMVANAFLHKFGIKMTKIIYGPKEILPSPDIEVSPKFEEEPKEALRKLNKVLAIATKGVWGCDMLQPIVILVAYFIHKFVF